MNFELVRKIKGLPVSLRCRAVGVSEQGLYRDLRQRERPGRRAAQDVVLGQELVAAHRVARGTYRTPRLKTALAHQGIRTSRKRISRIRRTWPASSQAKMLHQHHTEQTRFADRPQLAGSPI